MQREYWEHVTKIVSDRLEQKLLIIPLNVLPLRNKGRKENVYIFGEQSFLTSKRK